MIYIFHYRGCFGEVNETAGNLPSPGSEVPLIPVCMLNEYVYCPRLAYLLWVQGEFEHNHCRGLDPPQ